jgi:D-alanyl-lipoteichoic acid acyltransferase DltB (MBOAT superfamily)
MIFNSIPFFIFIGIFLPLYFALRGKARLWLCLIASYFFYGWWDYRFLSLIVISTALDYLVGLQLGQTEEKTARKRLMLLSMAVNLGFLAFFKYFNFFADSFADVLVSIGFEPSWHTLNIILPVGISFYTFQSMSYTIDVWKKEIPVEKNFLRFATFIAFFPQLVAGPIVRASEFLPQFQSDRKFDWNRIVSGSGQMLWGFFKKVAVADSLAPFVDQCFAAPDTFSSMHLFIGVLFYSFQIYCDFSGYSDIAIGLARMMGFDFPENFRTPYFSQDFSEFWKRWHITLSSWLGDYLYIPLGGNRNGSFGSVFFIGLFSLFAIGVTGWLWLIPAFLLIYAGGYYYLQQGKKQKAKTFTMMNLMVTMLLGGLWHGSSYAFIFWGFLHGAYLIFQRLLGPGFGKLLDSLRTPSWLRVGINVAIVFSLTSLAWIFFRSPDFETAMSVISGIANLETFNFGSVINKFVVLKGVFVVGILLMVEVSDLKFNYQELSLHKPVFRVVTYALLLLLIAFMGTFDSDAFIYFQF